MMIAQNFQQHSNGNFFWGPVFFASCWFAFSFAWDFCVHFRQGLPGFYKRMQQPRVRVVFREHQQPKQPKPIPKNFKK